MKVLPPTDSRLRPDQRLYENFEIEKAAAEKARLEDKQREARKEQHNEMGEESSGEHKPQWFYPVYDQNNGEISYRFNNKYWEKREQGDWSNCPDLFSHTE